MLRYEPDNTIAHRLDPRAKLAVQTGFAAGALAHTDPATLGILTAVTGLCLTASRTSLPRALRAYRYALVVLVGGPVASALVLGPPWIEPASAVRPALASYRVALVLLVSAAYVRSTPVRDTRAAIQRTVPGKPGQLLGIGVALVFRFFPVIRADLRRIRDAMGARLGTERGAIERASRLGSLGLSRAFDRADRLALALQARCFAWNPTLPVLSFSRRDLPALSLSAVLFAFALV